MKVRYRLPVLSSIVIGCICFVQSCVPPSNEMIVDVDVSLSDKQYQKLYDFQDKHEVDSLASYFRHPNPAYRVTAVKAMSSIQSEGVLDSLVMLLDDPIIDVRIAAAYAIGQIGNAETVDPLMNAFVNRDTIDVDNRFNSTILESVGKTGNKSLLEALASVESYRPTDTLLLLGQTRAIYRYALRGITTQKGTDRMIDLTADAQYPADVRSMAANYLARAKDIDIDQGKFRIAEALTSATDPRIRMAAALALRKSTDTDILKVLQSQLIVEKDYRVKVNILRALGSYKYISNIDIIIKYLEDENVHVANAAAQYLIDHGNRTDAEIYRSFANKDIDHSVKAKIYSSVLKHLPAYYTNSKSRVRNDIFKQLTALEGNPYTQALYIESLGYDPYNYSYLKEYALDSKEVIVRTRGMEALSRIVSSESFAKTFKSRSNIVKKEILQLIQEQIATGDSGLIAVAAGILSNPANEYKGIIESDTFLIQAAEKLSLPKEIESYNEIKKALAYINGVKYIAEKTTYNHPINWATLATVSDSTIAVVKTEKGNFTIKLFGMEAPGSVANFIDLAKDNFFDDKVYHRVVPNFVIQGGCPRGDGYGSLNYSIRSELSQLYYEDEGYIGMASAGKHTEGTQWFVTHSPTPHLDGKYTIFGKVIEGMNVVHDIVEGDKITDVIITELR